MQNLLADRSIYTTKYLYSQSNKAHTIAKTLQKMYHVSKSDETFFLTLKPTYSNKDNKVIALLGDADVDVFTHPIYLEGTEYIDIRPFTTKLGGIKDQSGYDNLVRRAILDMLWVEQKDIFYSPELGSLLARSFSDWISGILERGLGLDLRTGNNFKIILAIFMMVQLLDDHHMHQSDREGFILKRIKDVLKISPEYTMTLLDIYPTTFENLFEHPGSVFYLVKSLSDIMGIENGIDERNLYNLCAPGATMLSNSRELAQISLENIPTYISLLHSVNLPSMKSTKLGNILYYLRGTYGETLSKFMSLHTNYETVNV